MKVWRIKEVHCFGEAIIAAPTEQEAINMIDEEIVDLLDEVGKEVEYNTELIKNLEYNSSSPRIISCFIDY